MSKKTEVSKSDIFKESAMRVLTNKDKDEPIIEDDVIVPIEAGNWAELKIALKGGHAERFNDLLQKLPPREFIRTYLKVLEFVQPKVTRQIADPSDKEDNTLVIHVKRSGDIKEKSS